MFRNYDQDLTNEEIEKCKSEKMDHADIKDNKRADLRDEWAPQVETDLLF